MWSTQNYIIPDFETTNYSKGSPHDTRNHVVCLAILVCDNGQIRTFYFSFPKDVREQSAIPVFDTIQRIFSERPYHVVVGHGLKFDLHYFHRYNIQIFNPVFDTIFLPYLKLGGRHKKGDLSLAKLSKDKMPLGDLLVHKIATNPAYIAESFIRTYCVRDVFATQKLYLEECKELEQLKDEIYLKAPLRLMCELLPLLVQMERRGFRIDINKLQAIYNEQAEKREELISKLEHRIKTEFGVDGFSATSAMQVSQFLYSRKLKISHKLLWKQFFTNFNIFRPDAEKVFVQNVDNCFERLETGLQIVPPSIAINLSSLSSDKDSLKTIIRLNPKHPYLDIVNEFYEISKLDTLIDTYVEGILGNSTKKKPKYPKYFVHENSDTYLHTTYNQTLTKTARLSSSDPALQNWPREGTFPVKAIVISRFKNGKIASADASQIELRVGGDYHKDDKLRQDYEKGVDIHSNFAGQIFGPKFTDEQRTASKQTVFKVWYWGSAGGIVRDPKIPLWDIKVAEALVSAIYDRYTNVKLGQERDLATVKKLGYLKTDTGRIFYINPDHFSCKNKVANYPIQWGAFALMACALLVCEQAMRKVGLNSILFGTVHDDMIFDVYPGEEDKVKTIAMWALSTGAKLKYKQIFKKDFTFPLSGGFKIDDHWK